MTLVEVAPIIRKAARDHRLRAQRLREGDGPDAVRARADAMRGMREAGLSLPAIASFFGLDHTTVLHHVQRGGNGKAQAGSRCTDCDLVLPVAAFHRDPNRADGLQGRCKRHQLEADRRSRTVAFRRRPNGRERERVQVRVEPALADLLRDTAARHKTTTTAIVERAIARVLACKDCGQRLRELGSDCCAACDQEWTQEVAS